MKKNKKACPDEGLRTEEKSEDDKICCEGADTADCCGCEEAHDETELLKEALKEANDKLLRQQAETENYRKRLIKESDDKVKYANQSLVKKFLPVLDNFELALKHTEGATAETVLEGVELNRRAMSDILEKEGLELISAREGDLFDLNLHEALMRIQDESRPDGVITMVLQTGYKMGDRIIRPAKVQVNKIG